MKQWYQENYFSRRNWLLENINTLQLTPQETVILLLIDYDNEFKETITLEKLAEQSNMDEKEVDKTLSELVEHQYLQIKATKNKIKYDIDGIFNKKEELKVPSDIFEMFENEFKRPLSQKETMTLARWLQQYSQKSIVLALREAVKYNKLNFAYIEKIVTSVNDHV